jgi:2-oxoisovalerate dehydrogenase E2 component (dihydrolipoyl transacylase)
MVELATEKAVVEVTAPVSGQIIALNGALGEQVPVGAVLVVFETEVKPNTDSSMLTPSATHPSMMSVDSPTTPSSSLSPSSAPTVTSKSASADHAEKHAIAHVASRVMASPVVRRLAMERGIDLHSVKGSGPQGRIERRDVERWVSGGGRSSQPTAHTTPSAAQASAVVEADTGIRRLPVIGVRRVIADRMLQAVQTIPHITYVEPIDLTLLEAHRQSFNATLVAGEAKLTILPLFIQKLCLSLKAFPRMNAHYNAQTHTIEEYVAVQVGIATHTPDGLKVPVLTNAHSRSLIELRDELALIAERARTGLSKRQELTGSTITLSSLGKLGGVVSTPIINAPELVIIALNEAKPQVVVRDGEMVIRLMMNLSASFDHRFIDGYDAASFIHDLKARLESPDG